MEPMLLSYFRGLRRRQANGIEARHHLAREQIEVAPSLVSVERSVDEAQVDVFATVIAEVFELFDHGIHAADDGFGARAGDAGGFYAGTGVDAFAASRAGVEHVADALWRVAEAGATNVRFCSVDAVWSMEHLLGRGSVAELWTFFPDPWQKKKHHKRRLVQPSFMALVASRLEPGGRVHLATDWAEYAEQQQR